MLDISMFREHSDVIRADHDRRGLTHESIDEVIRLDEEWRSTRYNADQLRKARNEAARSIAEAKKSGDSSAADVILAEVADIGAQIDKLAEHSLRMRIPNILHAEVPIGEDDQKNTLHSMHGEKVELGFEPRNHNDLIEMNGWVDQARGAKVTGSRFYFMQGDLARLEMALQQYGADFLRGRGYTLVQPPLMMNRDAYEGVTDLADFETVMYGIEPDNYYLIATSEHPLTAMRMDEIIEPSELPIRLVGVSACFRREVGAHGLSDRGIWRVHQFTKVEQIVICHPDDSWGHHEELLGNAVDLWDNLGLHYYKEVVSCSNCTDYQANRLRMRYRTTEGNETVHTLNSTAIATSRALVAILEQNQMKDGRVSVPEALRPYMGGQETLEPLH